MSTKNHLLIAVDLGAESGRVIVGRLADARLESEEIYRFETGVHSRDGSLNWDLNAIEHEIERGLTLAATHQISGGTASLSVDSWGVDYVLMRDGQPLGVWPHHYRDPRTNAIFERVKSRFEAKIFGATGLQFLPFNTLYQLLAEREQNTQQWQDTDGFLLFAEYFTFRLSGVMCAEISLASTTQLFDPRTRNWSEELLTCFDLPSLKFPPIVTSGTVIGPLLPAIAAHAGLERATVVAACSHDTGAAVAAVPARKGDDWAFLSSGTWSLLGFELPQPLINDNVLRAGFTNEAGFGGTTRFLKNIVGLWIVQECRRFWQSQGHPCSYDELSRMAQDAEPFRCLIRPDNPLFAKPDEMPEKIVAFCLETGQTLPRTPGEFARCIFESLALLYRETLERAEELTQRSIARLHIVGGGSQNGLLNQLAANATGREVWAGPTEATALGNMGVQAIALGHLQSLDALRQIVRGSNPPRIFTSENASLWHEAYTRFQALKIL